MAASVVVLYHTGFGHTRALAEAVLRGARSVPSVEAQLVKAEEAEQHWAALDRADAIIFGGPTLSYDKLSTLVDFVMFAARMGRRVQDERNAITH